MDDTNLAKRPTFQGLVFKFLELLDRHFRITFVIQRGGFSVLGKLSGCAEKQEVRTGAVVRIPASSSVESFPVQIDKDDRISVALEDD